LRPKWVLEHIGEIFRSAGMEYFPDYEEDKPITLLAGGKSAVIDITVVVTPEPPSIALTSLKLNATSGTSEFQWQGLEALLRFSLEELIVQVQKPEADSMLVDKLSRSFRQHVESLMNLDALCAAEPAGDGERWFKEIALVTRILTDIHKKELEKLSR
jgi:hypothetical protein